MNEIYKNLRNVNVTDSLKKKGVLDYIPWATAWDELKTRYPSATFEIWRNEDGIPYVSTNAGLMVFTTVTVNGLSQSCFMPVLDHRNNAIPKEKATFGDVNRALMRCLTKNIALFGLGLNVYQGEEFVETSETEQAAGTAKRQQRDSEKSQLEAELAEICQKYSLDLNKAKNGLGLTSKPTIENYKHAIAALNQYVSQGYDLTCWRTQNNGTK